MKIWRWQYKQLSMERNSIFVKIKNRIICIFLSHLSSFFNVFVFIGTAVLVHDLCGRYDLTWRLSTILKSHESAHFPALYGPTTFTAINFIAITFNANINADDALKSNLWHIAHGRKNSFNFYHSHHKKEERKSKWPSDSHLWRVFYAPLLRYMNLISKFSFNAKDLLRQQLLPSWYSSHVLTKVHWTSKFFLHFFMKHIEIIIFFAILL